MNRKERRGPRSRSGHKRPIANQLPDSKRSSSKQELIGRGGCIVIGRNTIKEVLRIAPERFQKILIVGRRGTEDRILQDILEDARDKKILIDEVSSDELRNVAQSDSHQGIVAWLKDRQHFGLKETLREFDGKESSLILVLDSILDPQNLGALLRAAECFAVDAVVLSVNRGVGLTTVVTKASVGASELLRIISVSNLVDAIRKLKEANYWVVAADISETSVSIGSFKFPPRTAVLLGSEGKGIQALLRKEADFSVSIPLFGKISSLNVSQAAAIFLSQYRLQSPN